MKLPIRHRCAGITFVELMVAVGIMALMFGALGYLIIMTGRNTVLVSEQALSQNNAAAAAQRISAIIRNASEVLPVAGDDVATTLTRIKFHLPYSLETGEVNQTGVVAFAKADPDSTESDGVIKIFLDEADYDPSTVLTDKADYEFEGIQKFGIKYKTSTWITLNVFYSYRSYMNFASHDSDFDKKLAGEFITDVIAKNHHPGGSANYGQTTTSLFLL